MITIKTKYMLAAFTLLVLCSTIKAQDLTDNIKAWGSIGLSYKINKSFRVKASQLYAHNVSPSKYSFTQTSLSLAYRVKKGFYVESGYVRGLFNESNSLKRAGAKPSLFNKLAVDRMFGRVSVKQRITKRLAINHRVEFQYFFPDLRKHKTRTLYSARLGYKVKNSSIRPYLEGRIFYYQGGQRADDGFQRLRLRTGFSFKPIKNSSMRASLYCMIQDEFNTEPLSDNDYMVLGTALSFRL